jgi:hypothetical protein
MYVAMLAALLFIMSLLILVPCYLNKPLFNKVVPAFVFFLCWLLLYTISEIFDLNISIFITAAIAGVVGAGFDYLLKTRKLALLNRYFPES